MALFKKSLYLFLLYKLLVYILNFKELFGPHSLVYHKPVCFSGIKDLACLLSHFDCPEANAVMIGIAAAVAIAGLFRFHHLATNILLFVAMYNLTVYVYPTLTAGDLLMNQLLFFNIFLFTKPYRHAFVRDVQSALHNNALAGIKIQVCLVYVVASFYKLCDHDWLYGSAVYHALQVDEYSLPVLKSWPYWLYVLMSYFTLAYQALFPILVWIRPLKKYVLAIGVVQHLFIAFGIGLFSFGIIMIISYIIFLDLDRKS